MSYILYDSTLDITYNFTISQIINYVKNNINNKLYKKIDDKFELINNNMINTQFICHRINTITELKEIDPMFGVEIDLRDQDDRIILSHDPFSNGDTFQNYLEQFNHKLVILNIKSERIESNCLNLMNLYKIDDYFFLDSSFPMIYLLNNKYNNNKIAYRYSEYETLDNLKSRDSFYEWIWIDCFNILPLTKEVYQEIKGLNKKICIVSPELQNQPEKIKVYKQQLEELNIVPDAICCKHKNIIYWI